MHCCNNHSKKHSESKNSAIHLQLEESKQHSAKASKWLYLCAGGAIVALIAATVFKISPGNLLFYGALLACPLLHVFMMKDHGHGENHQEEKKPT